MPECDDGAYRRDAGHGVRGYAVSGQLADGLHPALRSGCNPAVEDRKETTLWSRSIRGAMGLRGCCFFCTIVAGKNGIVAADQ